jgi:hypothetical protein
LFEIGISHFNNRRNEKDNCVAIKHLDIAKSKCPDRKPGTVEFFFKEN